MGLYPEQLEQLIERRKQLANFKPSRDALDLALSSSTSEKERLLKGVPIYAEDLRTSLLSRIRPTLPTTEPPAVRRIISAEWLSHHLMEPNLSAAYIGYLTQQPTPTVCYFDLFVGLNYMNSRMLIVDLAEEETSGIAEHFAQGDIERYGDNEEVQFQTVVAENYLHLHGERKLSKVLLEEDQSGVVLLDECFKALKGQHSRYTLNPAIPPFAIDELVHFGAEWFRDMYMTIYPYSSPKQ